MTEEKNWDIKKGDFQKKHIHEEHKRFKKREKADNILLIFFAIVIIGVLIYVMTYI